MLRANLDGVSFEDFQDLDAWRRLVPLVANEITRLTRSSLVVAQTVLVEEYWSEVRRGVASQGLQMFHVVLDGDESVLRDRIAADREDPDAADWRLGHLEEFRTARTWMVDAADLVVDTTTADAAEVVAVVLDAVE